MTIELTDREAAVLIDSLAQTRDRLRQQGLDAPNVESALNKINLLMTPSTYGLRIELMPLNNLPGIWRWEDRDESRTDEAGWWRIHTTLNVEDGPHFNPPWLDDDEYSALSVLNPLSDLGFQKIEKVPPGGE
jgi:hypothetical protein